MTIPYNEAGQRAFDVFYRVAEKLYASAPRARRLLTFSMWSLGGNAANLPANTSTKDSGWWCRAKC